MNDLEKYWLELQRHEQLQEMDDYLITCLLAAGCVAMILWLVFG